MSVPEEQPTRRSVAALALFQREQEGQVQLLARWNAAWQTWTLVGGHKRPDETFRECLIRQIAEELDLHEGRDVLVASAPREHLEYTDLSRHTGEQTDYVIELFDVALVGDRAWPTIEQDPANRWLSEPEIMAGLCEDGRAVSPTARAVCNSWGGTCSSATPTRMMNPTAG